jgi:hypothetical protein
VLIFIISVGMTSLMDGYPRGTQPFATFGTSSPCVVRVQAAISGKVDVAWHFM